MRIFRNCLIILIVISPLLRIKAQELNCNIQVNSQQIQGSDKQIYQNMQTAIYEFMNNRKWTNNVFKNEERIECSILINIAERPSNEQFKASIQVQSRRPVFGSSYGTTMLMQMDKDFDFKYIDGQPIEYAENTYMGNLSAVLAYYAYVVIGMDYDSYSLYGGTPYLEKAMAIVNSAQGADEKGWKSFENQKNRYWLAENLTNANYKVMRESIYKYHRTGLDVMSDKVELGRSVITKTLSDVLQLKRNFPNLFIFQAYFTGKSDELVNIFKSAPASDKTEIVKVLNEIDPGNISKYKKIGQ